MARPTPEEHAAYLAAFRRAAAAEASGSDPAPADRAALDRWDARTGGERADANPVPPGQPPPRA